MPSTPPPPPKKKEDICIVKMYIHMAETCINIKDISTQDLHIDTNRKLGIFLITCM